jgi:alkanesulfonate monooxygenase SsuD/methylene tetrahydromethanopterin reductase-like flavin-dependent oxidoreductase (luciferase family)
MAVVKSQTSRPLTGEEYLESLRDGRQVYLYGERVKDVTQHPAFRNAALIAGEPALLRYLAERFAVVGPAEACIARLRQVAEAGVTNLLFTGFVRDRQRLIRELGERVLPGLAGGPS